MYAPRDQLQLMAECFRNPCFVPTPTRARNDMPFRGQTARRARRDYHERLGWVWKLPVPWRGKKKRADSSSVSHVTVPGRVRTAPKSDNDNNGFSPCCWWLGAENSLHLTGLTIPKQQQQQQYGGWPWIWKYELCQVGEVGGVNLLEDLDKKYFFAIKKIKIQ